MIQLVQFSTGAASAAVAERVRDRGTLVLMTANTLVEDPDNWRFALDVWDYLGKPDWHILTDGRTPMQAGLDARVIPNNRMAVCSRVLKREISRRYMDLTFDPNRSVVSLGYDWTEDNRVADSVMFWEPWQITFPLRDEPLIDKAEIISMWTERGINPPRLYERGHSHANCGGACVRGGHKLWRLLLNTDPETYALWEREEKKSRAELGDFAILRDRRGGTSRPMSLTEFRTREASEDDNEWGAACGCFSPDLDQPSLDAGIRDPEVVVFDRSWSTDLTRQILEQITADPRRR